MLQHVTTSLGNLIFSSNRSAGKYVSQQLPLLLLTNPVYLNCYLAQVISLHSLTCKEVHDQLWQDHTLSPWHLKRHVHQLYKCNDQVMRQNAMLH